MPTCEQAAWRKLDRPKQLSLVRERMQMVLVVAAVVVRSWAERELEQVQRQAVVAVVQRPPPQAHLIRMQQAHHLACNRRTLARHPCLCRLHTVAKMKQ